MATGPVIFKFGGTSSGSSGPHIMRAEGLIMKYIKRKAKQLTNVVMPRVYRDAGKETKRKKLPTRMRLAKRSQGGTSRDDNSSVFIDSSVPRGDVLRSRCEDVLVFKISCGITCSWLLSSHLTFPSNSYNNVFQIG